MTFTAKIEGSVAPPRETVLYKGLERLSVYSLLITSQACLGTLPLTVSFTASRNNSSPHSTFSMTMALSMAQSVESIPLKNKREAHPHGLSSGRRDQEGNRRRKLSPLDEPSLNIMDLSEDIFSLVADFCLGGIQDVRTVSSVSREVRLAVTSVARDGNAPLWENEFRNRDPILHQCYVTSKDDRSTWQTRLVKLLQLRTESFLDKKTFECRADQANPFAPTMCDVILHNHPDQGFLVNVGGTRSSVVIYGVRQSPTPGTLSSSVKFAEHFNIPTFAAGAAAPIGPSSDNLLVLHSLDGVPVSAHRDFDQVISTIKHSDELCRWRFLFYPKVNLPSALMSRLPSECVFTGQETFNQLLVL